MSNDFSYHTQPSGLNKAVHKKKAGDAALDHIGSWVRSSATDALHTRPQRLKASDLRAPSVDDVTRPIERDDATPASEEKTPARLAEKSNGSADTAARMVHRSEPYSHVRGLRNAAVVPMNTSKEPEGSLRAEKGSSACERSRTP